MSCKECDEAHDQDSAFYYRIENGNVQVKGCRKHVTVMFDRLNNGIELLAALKGLVEYFPTILPSAGLPNKKIEAARAAIAKAEEGSTS